jgi:hypothetical protein
MHIGFSQCLHRVKKLWVLVLAYGFAYLYLAMAYLEANVWQYFHLGKIFIAANVAMGIVEIVFFLYLNKRVAALVFPASLFDIIFGASIIFLPFISIVFLPMYVSISQVLRGSIYLVLFNRGAEYSVRGLDWLKYLGWARILWAVVVLILFVSDINQSKLPAAIAMLVDGLLVIGYAIRLKLLQYAPRLGSALFVR